MKTFPITAKAITTNEEREHPVTNVRLPLVRLSSVPTFDQCVELDGGAVYYRPDEHGVPCLCRGVAAVDANGNVSRSVRAPASTQGLLAYSDSACVARPIDVVAWVDVNLVQ